MTLAELGMAFWHDLAVPVITGILASMIVSWLNKRTSGCRNGNLRPDQAAEVKLCGLFRKKNATVASG